MVEVEDAVEVVDFMLKDHRSEIFDHFDLVAAVHAVIFQQDGVGAVRGGVAAARDGKAAFEAGLGEVRILPNDGVEVDFERKIFLVEALHPDDVAQDAHLRGGNAHAEGVGIGNGGVEPVYEALQGGVVWVGDDRAALLPQQQGVLVAGDLEHPHGLVGCAIHDHAAFAAAVAVARLIAQQRASRHGKTKAEEEEIAHGR